MDDVNVRRGKCKNIRRPLERVSVLCDAKRGGKENEKEEETEKIDGSRWSRGSRTWRRGMRRRRMRRVSETRSRSVY